MAKEFRYVLPVEQTQWAVAGESSAVLRWDYDQARGDLLALYDKGKARQWDAAQRIDWSQDLDPENPVGINDRFISIHGSDMWQKLTEKERANLRRHTQAWQFSQFLHGEQGALVCAAKIVEAAPGLDAKFYAATQTMDEARHVEAFSRLLREKFDLAYPIMPPLKALLDDVVSDSRWDMTFLGMQVLIEGLALAAFQLFRDNGTNPLVRSVNAYVMEDEARHVAFGRLALRDYYPQLSSAERREREDFVIEASYLMRDRFLAEDLWEVVGLPKQQCLDYGRNSETMQGFRTRLFGRIVPTVRDIGLMGPKVTKAFADMGVLDFAQIDTDALLARDEELAASLGRT
ncbi:MAG TPA: ferritin-like domain-containing protein [Stellaceae bacterium]|nr:ferritin-like domain-containing protein [Stellaceae bacterium]